MHKRSIDQRHSRYPLFTMSILEMKSLASSDVSANSGSSKFHLAAKMLLRVSLSSSPRNGERPLRLSESDQFLLLFTIPLTCTCAHWGAGLQHVCDDAEAPHVRVERHKVIVDHLGSKKLWSTEIDSKLLPRFIAAWGIII